MCVGINRPCLLRTGRVGLMYIFGNSLSLSRDTLVSDKPQFSHMLSIDLKDAFNLPLTLGLESIVSVRVMSLKRIPVGRQ